MFRSSIIIVHTLYNIASKIITNIQPRPESERINKSENKHDWRTHFELFWPVMEKVIYLWGACTRVDGGKLDFQKLLYLPIE